MCDKEGSDNPCMINEQTQEMDLLALYLWKKAHIPQPLSCTESGGRMWEGARLLGLVTYFKSSAASLRAF